MRQAAKRALLVASIIVLHGGTARAELSSYRVTEIAPARTGAELTIAYSNAWSTPAQTEANATLRFYVYTAYKTQAELNAQDWIRPAPFHKPQAIEVGDFKCAGQGLQQIPLDYAKLGLAPGQQVLTSVCFLGCGHEWGASQGREAGQVTLPAPLAAAKTAQRNSWLRQRRDHARAVAAPRLEYHRRRAGPERPARR